MKDCKNCKYFCGYDIVMERQSVNIMEVMKRAPITTLPILNLMKQSWKSI